MRKLVTVGTACSFVIMIGGAAMAGGAIDCRKCLEAIPTPLPESMAVLREKELDLFRRMVAVRQMRVEADERERRYRKALCSAIAKMAGLRTKSERFAGYASSARPLLESASQMEGELRDYCAGAGPK